MKNIFKLYLRDMRNIFSNYAALIVAIALCILPSLYAWFNIEASWDPYSQNATSQIKIGVVNKDKGTDLNGKYINIGDKVIEGLKGNKQMGWQFVSEEEAYKNVEEGDYYATLTIPENFSENLTSILSVDIKKGEIIYTVNEKINAIAPKLTDKGATGVQENVSKALVETVSNAIFSVGNEVGITLEGQLPRITNIYNALLQVQSHFSDINEVADMADEGATKTKDLVAKIQGDIPRIEETVKNAKELTSELESFLKTSKGSINKFAPSLKQDIKLVGEISRDVGKTTDGLINAISAGSDKIPVIIDNLLAKATSLRDMNKSLIRALEVINKINPASNLTETINTLKGLEGKIEVIITSLNEAKNNEDKIDTTRLNQITDMSNQIASSAEDLYGRFDGQIMPSINNILDKAYTVADDSLKILQQVEAKIPDVQGILTTVYEGVDKGEEGIKFIKGKLPEAEQTINDIVDKMNRVENGNGFTDIINILKSDVEKRSDFLANPVEIVENKLFPIANYGTGMTPFYTVLSLWVGILLLSSIFTVNAYGNYTSTEIYFGKLLLFMTIAVIQALIVSLGDLYILKIYCVNPALFVVGSVFTSIVFTFIVYSLVSVFGNVGKVIAIILLVLQVAGSGGTFPIQLTPRFFQIINPYLPFTYCISFAREAIGGVVPRIVSLDICAFLVYISISLVIALLLKEPINKISRGFIESFENSGVGE